MAFSYLLSELYGLNVYKPVGDLQNEEYQAGIEAMYAPSSAELSYVPVRNEKDRTIYQFVPAPAMPNGQWERLVRAVQGHQSKLWGSPDFEWPLDLAASGRIRGAILRNRLDKGRQNLQSFLANAAAPRWELSKNLLLALWRLHIAGLAMDGFSRSQVFVEPKNSKIRLFGGFFLQHPDGVEESTGRGDFFLLPASVAERQAKEGRALTAGQKDLFSAVTMAFYLLFYTHPFIGLAYRPLPRDAYFERYSKVPEFIFNTRGKNGLGLESYDRTILEQWERTTPALRTLFLEFYEKAFDASARDAKEPLWQFGTWIEALEEDAKKQSGETHLTEFPFQMVAPYMV